jgi:hypothetical protein
VAERKSVLIRIDPALHDVLQRWAAAEFRSLNAQIEFALRQAATAAGRLRPEETGARARKEG